jgi:hypothetical protein
MKLNKIFKQISLLLTISIGLCSHTALSTGPVKKFNRFRKTWSYVPSARTTLQCTASFFLGGWLINRSQNNDIAPQELPTFEGKLNIPNSIIQKLIPTDPASDNATLNHDTTTISFETNKPVFDGMQLYNSNASGLYNFATNPKNLAIASGAALLAYMFRSNINIAVKSYMESKTSSKSDSSSNGNKLQNNLSFIIPSNQSHKPVNNSTATMYKISAKYSELRNNMNNKNIKPTKQLNALDNHFNSDNIHQLMQTNQQNSLNRIKG